MRGTLTDWYRKLKKKKTNKNKGSLRWQSTSNRQNDKLVKAM